MKKKSRIKLYQIKLIGNNFKFNKTVIGFKSYSRVCSCSSQVYIHQLDHFDKDSSIERKLAHMMKKMDLMNGVMKKYNSCEITIYYRLIYVIKVHHCDENC